MVTNGRTPYEMKVSCTVWLEGKYSILPI